MPSTTVDRKRGVERHLAAAKEYLAIAESGDVTKTAYEHAADEIIAAMKEDSSLSYNKIDRQLGRSKSGKYSGRLVAWRKNSTSTSSPFAENDGRKRISNAETRRVARERPEDYVEAFRQAPAAARKAIAKEISKTPEIRAEARQRDVEAETTRKPSPVKPRVDRTLYEFESRLVSARRDLRDALALVDGIDQPGEDEDILELLELLKGLVAANDEAYRSGKSLDTWAWELYERSAD